MSVGFHVLVMYLYMALLFFAGFYSHVREGLAAIFAKILQVTKYSTLCKVNR